MTRIAMYKVCLFLRLTDRKGSCGKIHLMAEELQDNKFDVHIQLSASKLDKKDFFGKVGILRTYVCT